MDNQGLMTTIAHQNWRRMGVVFTVLIATWILVSQNGSPMSLQAQETSGITAPVVGSTVRGAVPVMGTAMIGSFNRYELYYKPAAADDSAYQYFADGVEPVTAGQLGVWDTSELPPGEYTLRLRVVQADGNYTEHFVDTVTVAPDAVPTSPPAPPQTNTGTGDPAQQTNTTPATPGQTSDVQMSDVQMSAGRTITGTVSRTITTVGRGTASAAADYAFVRLFVVGSDQSTSALRLVGENDLQQVASTLQSLGVSEAITTVPFSRTPSGTLASEIQFIYRQPGNLSAFLANLLNQLSANPTVRIIDVAMRFAVDNCAALEGEAMRAALIEARARAEPLVQVLNLQLGPAVAVTENVADEWAAVGCAALAAPATFQSAEPNRADRVEVSVSLAISFAVEAVGGAGQMDTTPAPTPFLVTPTPESPGTPQQGNTMQHTVVAGETIESIAGQYGVRVEDILLANNLTLEEAQVLNPGQTLEIPQGTP